MQSSETVFWKDANVHTDIVKPIVEVDLAQVQQCNLFGLSAIHYAIRNGRIGASFFH